MLFDTTDEPSFLHEGDEDRHAFTRVVLHMANWANVDVRMVTPYLVAWLVYLAKQVATVSKRKRGRVGVSTRVRSDLESHNHWNKGIASALKFMRDPDQSPTSSPLVLSIQKKRRAL